MGRPTTRTVQGSICRKERVQETRPAEDLAVPARVDHLISWRALVDDGVVTEAEIKPLIIRSDCVVVVGALVRIANH